MPGELRAKENLSDALWMSALAGLAGVFIEGVIVGSLYLFDPVARTNIESWTVQLLVAAAVIFLSAFGTSLWCTLAVQMRRGK